MTDTAQAILRVEEQLNVHVVRFLQSSILDGGDVEAVDATFAQIVDASADPRVVLDLENLSHVCSMMLSSLIELRSLIQDKGGRLATANIQPRLRDLLETVRIYDVFENHLSVESAVTALLD